MTQIQSAQVIAGHLLQETGIALMDRDCDAFMRHIAFPHTIETFQGEQRIETEGHFRAVFQSFRDHLCKIGVTDAVRRVIEASFKTDTRIESTHEVRLLNGDVLVQTPYVAYSVILWDGKEGRWKIASSIYAITDAPELNAALVTVA
ncbi:MAG: hypothetical protein HKN30_00695 [Sulfitobacter sp.]|nr:hypothetical protein [Sulfitobacter sp.]